MKFDGVLVDLMGCPEVVRLNQIKQLGLSYLVFPGAHHTRFEHSLGVSYIAGTLGREIGLDRDEVRLIMAAGMLHDIGHGPFSHTLEGIFHEKVGLDHMQLTKDLIDGEADLDLEGWVDPSWDDTRDANEILVGAGIDPKEVSSLVCQEKGSGEQSTLLNLEDGPRSCLGQIIHSALDADQLDFLLRDSHYTGVAHGTIDLSRIVQTSILHNGDLMVHKKGITALEGMLVARSLMYSSVYFHKTARIAESMLCRAVSAMPEEGLERMWGRSDAEVLRDLRDIPGLTGQLARRLRMRRLYKAAYRIESESAMGDDTEADAIRGLVRFASGRERVGLERAICRKAEVPEGSVIVDVPDPALTLSEPRLKRTDVLVLSDRPTYLSRLSPIARSLQHRPTVPWCLMVSCPPEMIGRVRKVAPRVLLAE